MLFDSLKTALFAFCNNLVGIFMLSRLQMFFPLYRPINFLLTRLTVMLLPVSHLLRLHFLETITIVTFKLLLFNSLKFSILLLKPRQTLRPRHLLILRRIIQHNLMCQARTHTPPKHRQHAFVEPLCLVDTVLECGADKAFLRFREFLGV